MTRHHRYIKVLSFMSNSQEDLRARCARLGVQSFSGLARNRTWILGTGNPCTIHCTTRPINEVVLHRDSYSTICKELLRVMPFREVRSMYVPELIWSKLIRSPKPERIKVPTEEYNIHSA
jgi:hypothetical protein